MHMLQHHWISGCCWAAKPPDIKTPTKQGTHLGGPISMISMYCTFSLIARCLALYSANETL